MNRNKISSADVGEKKNTEKKLGLDQIIDAGKKFRQLGLYLFIWYWYQVYKDGVDFGKLWRFYNNISDHVVSQETVRKQLKMLMSKNLIEERGRKYYPTLLPADIVIKMFDVERSRAGKTGAVKRVRQILYRNQMPFVQEMPKNLKYYVERVVQLAVRLARQGKHETVLDLLVHTLLPLRENAVLWIWKGDEFIYYERKVMSEGVFHSVRFPVLADLLKKLGFKEGVMVYHLLGHDEAKDIIHRLFGKGHLSWPWARSLFYKLKESGFAEEGNRYIIELEYKDMGLAVYLRDIYNSLLKKYLEPWFNEGRLPLPLSDDRTKVRYLVIGRQHIKPENEESYFTRW